jgi:hypothetical protein
MKLKFSSQTFIIFFFLALTLNTVAKVGATTFFNEEVFIKDDSFTDNQRLVNDSIILKKGDTESSAIGIYIPVNVNDSLKDSRNFHSYLSEIPLITSGLPLRPKVILNLRHDLGINRNYYVIVKREADSLNEVIQIISSPNSTADRVEISISELCRVGRCRLDLQGADSINDTQPLYIVAAPTNAALLNSVVDTNLDIWKAGIHLNFKFSSLFDNSGVPKFLSLNRGDSQLIIGFDQGNLNSNIIQEPHQMLSIVYPNSTEVVNQTSYKKALETHDAEVKLINIPPNNIIVVDELTNDVASNVSFAYVNKFQFVSIIPSSKIQTPISLELFLKEKKCFLLSAGFGTDHFIIEYFRNFRDQFLLTNFIGSKFVKFYYEWALPLAPVIAHNQFLKITIQKLSYLVYYLFNYFLEIILTLSMLLLGFHVFSTHFKKSWNPK